MEKQTLQGHSAGEAPIPEEKKQLNLLSKPINNNIPCLVRGKCLFQQSGRFLISLYRVLITEFLMFDSLFIRLCQNVCVMQLSIVTSAKEVMFSTLFIC